MELIGGIIQLIFDNLKIFGSRFFENALILRYDQERLQSFIFYRILEIKRHENFWFGLSHLIMLYFGKICLSKFVIKILVRLIL